MEEINDEISVLESIYCEENEFSLDFIGMFKIFFWAPSNGGNINEAFRLENASNFIHDYWLLVWQFNVFLRWNGSFIYTVKGGI